MSEIEVLEVSDGTVTNTVSFLAKNAGFVLDEWTPVDTQPKDGGVFKDSKLADGRYPAMIRWANVTETFTFKITGDFYTSLRKLKILLNKGQDYWMTTSAHEPVWIKVKGQCEGYPRYSLIVGWRVSGENNPFETPVSGNVKPAMDNFTLVIERKPFWSNEQPGTATAVELGVTQTYDGRTLGNVDDAGVAEPTTAAEVFFANQHDIAQLTNIYEDDGGVWVDLIDVGPPFRLLPANTVINDAIYFVIDFAVANSGPFSSLVLDILTAVGGGEVVVWEYWNGVGASWDTFPINGGGWLYLADNTDALTNTGVNALYWDHPPNWRLRNLALDGGPAVNGWAIRARATVGGGTGGIQQHRRPYTINWPYVEFQSDQIGGDVSALLRGILRNESNYDDDQDYQKYWDIFTMGLRSVDRGADFTAYLPLANTQWPTGVTTALEGGAITTFIDQIQYSSRGRAIEYDPIAPIATMQPIWSITLDNTVANQYQGRFQVYVRYRLGWDNEYAWQMQIRAGYANMWWSEIVNVTRAIDVRAVYFGSLTFPPANVAKQENIEEVVITLYGTAILGTVSPVEFIDVILLPADEWLGTLYRDYSTYATKLDATHYLDIDSVTAPKSQLYVPKKFKATDYLVEVWNHINVAGFQTNINQRMRLWTMGQDYRGTGALTYCPISTGGTFQLSMAQRYFSAIGDTL